MTEERLVRFSLFGQDFSFYTDAPEEEVAGAVALLRQEFEDTEQASRSVVPSSKMLVLGCLRIAARYVELEKEFQRFRRQQEQEIDRMLEKVAANLEDTT